MNKQAHAVCQLVLVLVLVNGLGIFSLVSAAVIVPNAPTSEVKQSHEDYVATEQVAEQDKNVVSSGKISSAEISASMYDGNPAPEDNPKDNNDSAKTTYSTPENQDPLVKKAPNVDLKEVAPVPEPAPQSLLDEELGDELEAVTEPVVPPIPDGSVDDADVAKPFVILGAEVAPATATRLAWSPDNAISGLASPTPVLVINGSEPGPTLCLTGAIHGDELNGIEIVRRVIYDIDPEALKGKLIGVPIVNLQGFQRVSRYLPDRRDLNRYFPGRPTGSLAARIANSLFRQVIKHCDYLVDIHTGSMLRNNLPQIRADMRDPKIIMFSELFDDIAIVHSKGSEGMLRVAAVQAGIPTVTLEAGESLRIQEGQIKSGAKSILGLLERLGMYNNLFVWGDPKPVYYQSYWIRASRGGILYNSVRLGAKIEVGEVLGTIVDPITNEKAEIQAAVAGRVIGMASNQVVMPGFAAYHIGTESTNPLPEGGNEGDMDELEEHTIE